ncbi:flagellar protein FlaG [Marinitoga piezophila KA3]|uniref:Flagellar protein FlaG n=1 Tax=Marinitoga piezophila (strain DSM 14283 / JCM 11233 / KA3) TaxID=443254 RepID=H2J718_MARPK|nr:MULTISPECIES: flagellar protein FlaG [Marinitoga]AEX86388.1 flagellar protein FlaG [Marinitoga piezophila KA3]
MGDLNRISGDFGSFIDSITRDAENSRRLSKNNNNIGEEHQRVQSNQNQQKNNEIKDPEVLSKMIEEKLNKLREIFKGEVKFEVNNDVDMVIVKIIDKDSKKVIRQIPPETAVKIAEMLDKLEGILLDERA